jgi:hypothetical protein
MLNAFAIASSHVEEPALAAGTRSGPPGGEGRQKIKQKKLKQQP